MDSGSSHNPSIQDVDKQARRTRTGNGAIIMMQTDVKSSHIEATGTAVAYRTRIRGYQFITGGTAGDITFRDGGSGGPILIEFNIATAPTNPMSFTIPGEGVLFSTDVHITLPTDAKITVFYG